MLDLLQSLTRDVHQPTEQALTPGGQKSTSEPVPLSRKVRSLRNIRILVPVGGKTYKFEPLGVSEVDDVDLEYILSLKSRGGGCCGSRHPGGEPHFKLED